MSPKGTTGEWSIALFLLGVLLFNPPLLSIFAVERFFAGVPVVYIYLFVTWCALVGFVALTARTRRASNARRTPDSPSEPLT